MTLSPDWPDAGERSARRRRPILRWLLLLLGSAGLFAVGVALGDALDDNEDPERSPTQTLVRTLGPLPLSAPPTVTVTVTAARP
ncbi:MAG: hypothetical protein ICV59_00710 [Thermoleophilia bacterium]|nr:hypothetical protein [Thermoleophilia bacterium]